MKIIFLLKPSLQLKKERFWLFVIKILNVALLMNESRKIIKKDDPIGNEQWAIDVIKDIGLYDQRIYWNGYHPEDMPYINDQYKLTL